MTMFYDGNMIDVMISYSFLQKELKKTRKQFLRIWAYVINGQSYVVCTLSVTALS